MKICGPLFKLKPGNEFVDADKSSVDFISAKMNHLSSKKFLWMTLWVGEFYEKHMPIANR